MTRERARKAYDILPYFGSKCALCASPTSGYPTCRGPYHLTIHASLLAAERATLARNLAMMLRGSPDLRGLSPCSRSCVAQCWPLHLCATLRAC